MRVAFFTENTILKYLSMINNVSLNSAFDPILFSFKFHNQTFPRGSRRKILGTPLKAFTLRYNSHLKSIIKL